MPTRLAPLAVRGTPAELAALVGQRIAAIRRRGKFLLIDLDRDRIVVNPMLTGRFQLAAPEAKHPTKTALVIGLGPRTGGPPKGAAKWTRGAPGCRPTAHRPRSATATRRRWARSTCCRRRSTGRSRVSTTELGPEADDPRLSLDDWRTRIRRHPGELKNLLKNQAFVAGIGNAYSDEILHAARLLPFRKRSSLAPEEVDALYDATGTTLRAAVEVLRERVPPTFETQVRDFLAVHNKGGTACPRCGTRITEVKPGGFVTSYCRGCQR